MEPGRLDGGGGGIFSLLERGLPWSDEATLDESSSACLSAALLASVRGAFELDTI